MAEEMARGRQKMKQWAAYKRCPFYDPACKHTEPKPQQDLIGMCTYYYFEMGACSMMEKCDSYGWVAAPLEELAKIRLIMQDDGL
jgi:hypothetical protein